MFSTPSSKISVPLDRCPLMLKPTPRVVAFCEFPLDAFRESPLFVLSPADTLPASATKSYGLRVRLGICETSVAFTICDSS